MCTISRDMVKNTYCYLQNGGHLRFQDGRYQKNFKNVGLGHLYINYSQKYDKY